MSWLLRYRIRTYVESSLWIMPLIGLLLAITLAPLLRAVDARTRWTLLAFTPEGARAVLGAVVSSTFGFIVFVFSMLLLSVQIASAQLTPRIIARVMRDRRLKLALTVFVFTDYYSVATLGRIHDHHVPQLTVFVAVVATVLSVCVFLYLIDHVARMLRPVSILAMATTEGLNVIQLVYPALTSAEPESEPALVRPPDRIETVLHEGTPGALLAFDTAGLVRIASRHDLVLELVPRVGQFVPAGAPLFRVRGDRAAPARALRAAVALGPERTIQQDPAFAFRILVDIASKALSPAINDPTTAVTAIDQLQHLLGQLGLRQLTNSGFRDRGGTVRLVVRTPDWEDFVRLAVTEVRLFGGGSIQVARRLRAMLESLLESLPPLRAAPLEHELALLHRAVDRLYAEVEDRQSADARDVQGLGSSE